MNNSNKRCSWSAAEIATLVDSVKENNIMKLLDGKRYRNADIYEIVRLDLEKIGSSKTVAQVRAKWKALKSGYSEKNRVNKISGSNRMSCNSEKELDEVLGTRPSIKPLDFGTDSTKENDMEFIDEIEECITSVNEENEDVSYEVVYQQEDQLDTSPVQNKGTKTLSQKREFRRKNRNSGDLLNMMDSFNKTMEGHKDFIREENEKQRKWEEEILKADQEQAQKDKEEFTSLLTSLLKPRD
ncbi:uncharacterized protein LOC111030902 [Myzus persicae]|uniref:uncharacterized protein LOC111030902 n=1 Tax=Myzus persicae TaxID=13164 RepID=UPI000B9342E8|nr:uncharacterized protein LOC111030902 [Myzus persicae]